MLMYVAETFCVSAKLSDSRAAGNLWGGFLEKRGCGWFGGAENAAFPISWRGRQSSIWTCGSRRSFSSSKSDHHLSRANLFLIIEVSRGPYSSQKQIMGIRRDDDGPWQNGAKAAISLTFDNMGEAADLQRGLWGSDPVGNHYTVTQVIPRILLLLKKYGIPVTYLIESWNIKVYGEFILKEIAAAGHEIGWHGWQHEPWAKLSSEEEQENFALSFGTAGIQQWLEDSKSEPYAGFRPPGGLIHTDRTLELCQQHHLKYISPAGENAARVNSTPSGNTMIVLPFRWVMVDAYYYMATFAGLRRIKGEYSEEQQSSKTLVDRFILEIDAAIDEKEFLSILFHPFLTQSLERFGALETVLAYLAKRRDAGDIWLAPCRDVALYVEGHPNVVGTDPQWDLSQWR